MVRSSGGERVVGGAVATASMKPPSSVAETSRQEESPAPPSSKSQPLSDTPSTGKKAVSSKGDSKASVDGTAKAKPSKGESGADATSKSKPPRESGALGDTPKPKAPKDTYADQGLNSNEFADVGAEESVFPTPKKDFLETSSSVTPGLHKSASK